MDPCFERAGGSGGFIRRWSPDVRSQLLWNSYFDKLRSALERHDCAPDQLECDCLLSGWGKLAAVALNLSGVYTSTDSGVNWTLQTNGLASYSGFTDIASSADGTKLVAAAGGTTNGPIFTSTNLGVDWTQATNAPLARWYSVASSADGNKLLVCAYPGNVYLSTDAGLTWTETSLPTNNWNSVAESADGTKMWRWPIAAP